MLDRTGLPRRLSAPRKRSPRPAASFRSFRPASALAPRVRGGAEEMEVGLQGVRKILPNPGGRKMGAEIFRGRESAVSSYPYSSCQMAWENCYQLAKAVGPKKTKSAGPANGSTTGGYSRTGLSFAGESGSNEAGLHDQPGSIPPPAPIGATHGSASPCGPFSSLFGQRPPRLRVMARDLDRT